MPHPWIKDPLPTGTLLPSGDHQHVIPVPGRILLRALRPVSYTLPTWILLPRDTPGLPNTLPTGDLLPKLLLHIAHHMPRWILLHIKLILSSPVPPGWILLPRGLRSSNYVPGRRLLLQWVSSFVDNMPRGLLLPN